MSSGRRFCSEAFAIRRAICSWFAFSCALSAAIWFWLAFGGLDPLFDGREIAGHCLEQLRQIRRHRGGVLPCGLSRCCRAENLRLGLGQLNGRRARLRVRSRFFHQLRLNGAAAPTGRSSAWPHRHTRIAKRKRRQRCTLPPANRSGHAGPGHRATPAAPGSRGMARGVALQLRKLFGYMRKLFICALDLSIGVRELFIRARDEDIVGSIVSGFGMEFIGAPFPRQNHPRGAVGFPPDHEPPNTEPSFDQSMTA